MITEEFTEDLLVSENESKQNLSDSNPGSNKFYVLGVG